MELNEYLEELTDNNWHTLRELIEYQQGTLTAEMDEEVARALECAIAYLQWTRYYSQNGETVLEFIERRLGWMNGTR